MKQKLKIFLALVMLALMTYNMVGYVFVFEVADFANREKMEMRLGSADDSQLQPLKVSDLSSVVRKADHEIVFEGRHYDVKKEVVENGYTVFYCIHDKAEENFYTGLSDSVNANSDVQAGKQNTHAFSVLKIFTKDFFFQVKVEKIAAASPNTKAFSKDESFSSTVFSSVIKPPPKA